MVMPETTYDTDIMGMIKYTETPEKIQYTAEQGMTQSTAATETINCTGKTVMT